MSRAIIKIEGDAEIDRLLASLPGLIVATGGPIDKAMSKAAMVVAKRARQLAPNSKKSGTESKQSEKSKKKWPHDIRRMIKPVVRKYDKKTVAVVGTVHPEGNAAHFMQEKPRRHVLWGKRVAIQEYRIERNWITKAFDETKSEQNEAITSSLRSEVDKVMRGG